MDGSAAPPWLRRMAWSTVGMVFLVNLMGFLDTHTGSALGCGAEWPLCSGHLVPSQWNLQRAVEFGHRGIVMLAVILTVFTGIWALRSQSWRPGVRWWVAMGLAFVAIQAALGALAVVFVNPSWVLAFHFGCSLLALSGFFLLALTLGRRPNSWGRELQSREVRPIRRQIWTLLVFTYGVVYYSAYVAFLGDGLACGGWPLCRSRWIPLGGAEMVDFGHRVAALMLAGLSVSVFLQIRKRRRLFPDLYRTSATIVALVVLQSLSGAYVALSHSSTTSFMIHVAGMMWLFSAECMLAWQAMPQTMSLSPWERGRDRPIGG